MLDQIIELKVYGRRWVIYPAMMAVAKSCNTFIIQAFT
ncbi:hypothetical protein YPPY66_3894 [Yersinia pestis PY-66]|uniref:Uncharacterized protein n=2 Tax=Yersinia pestis TaxID=632 RepID=A0AAV3BJS8_YERPE|nr:hypothetical protein YPIP275_3592 [Yersinia pestis biovar Orientalis str. IP275]EDR63090.1 hypothetical protein YpUG050454_1194 [Yersinia pestis biovar Antiqua str. UG05-0454]EIR15305.1 hypothetical protein YPPY08_3613 [Yersinia pestis PY-08]EIR30129.1 hypothetical protein YPPY11_3706 [Yersinia pestis PY-11]EIR44605.1 hypothetical protein YPPY15_3558 [Yersinia pestis PY-15]EIR74366.1 hypothetical protein YPPY32_3863 [Yersinia pestis PY-32]EIR87827.1 hypothetical protein YPPY42_3619 [Yersin